MDLSDSETEDGESECGVGGDGAGGGGPGAGGGGPGGAADDAMGRRGRHAGLLGVNKKGTPPLQQGGHPGAVLHQRQGVASARQEPEKESPRMFLQPRPGTYIVHTIWVSARVQQQQQHMHVCANTATCLS